MPSTNRPPVAAWAVNAAAAIACGCRVHVGTTAVPTVIVLLPEAASANPEIASSSVVCAIQYDVEAVGLRLSDVRRDRTQIGSEQLVRAIDPHTHAASVCRARMRS